MLYFVCRGLQYYAGQLGAVSRHATRPRQGCGRGTFGPPNDVPGGAGLDETISK